MSGHKRGILSIQQAQRNRFSQAGRQLDIVANDYTEVKAKIQEIQKNHFDTSIQSLQSRQQYLDQSLLHLDDNLRTVENGISQAILDQAHELQQQYDVFSENILTQTTCLLDDQTRALEKYLDQALFYQQSEFEQLQMQVLSLQQYQTHKRQVASETLRSTNELFETLLRTYDLDRLIPGLAGEVMNDLRITQENIASGFYEAGLTSAQQIYTRLSSARIKIENIVMQHAIACSTAIARGTLVLEKFDLQSKVKAIDLEGNPLDFNIDVDYWSWGAWRDWRKRCLRFVQRLQRNSDQLEITEVNNILGQIDECEAALPEIVYQARENILASQIRFNLAECIVCSLQEQGFFVDNSDYQNTDQRQPYLTSLKNIEGSRVTIQLSPQANNPIFHTIDLVSEDHGIRTEHELRQRAKVLRDSLKAYGLQVNFSTVQDPNTNQGIFTPTKLQVNSDRREKVELGFEPKLRIKS
jgi:exonuclease VII small subunit